MSLQIVRNLSRNSRGMWFNSSIARVRMNMSTEGQKLTTSQYQMQQIISQDTASEKDKLNMRITSTIDAFKMHETDRGSSGVQIAVMTEKIKNLVRHFAQHKKDKHSMRGFQQLLSKRRYMMKYMKKNDFEGFKEVVKKLGLEREAVRL
jgi:small subunit ribosomal protein S15